MVKENNIQITATKAKEDLFGKKVNEQLLAQAVRVYQANKRQGTASTKTRSQVSGSRRKIYRQKGTGRARHGDKYAPIFVGGGIAHGPKPKDWSLKLTKKMRKKALASALSLQAQNKKIFIFSNLEKLEPKTKKYFSLFQNKLKFDPEKDSILLVLDNKNENILRGVRNIKGLSVAQLNLINAYMVLRAKKIAFTKTAIDKVKELIK